MAGECVFESAAGFLFWDEWGGCAGRIFAGASVWASGVCEFGFGGDYGSPHVDFGGAAGGGAGDGVTVVRQSARRKGDTAATCESTVKLGRNLAMSPFRFVGCKKLRLVTAFATHDTNFGYASGLLFR
jgi:hypothetical protein